MDVRKHLLFFYIVTCFSLCLFNYGIGATSEDAVALKKLEDRARKFETIFYYSERIDSAIYLDGFAVYRQLIDSYISLNRKSPDRKFAAKAYYYLERFKSIKLLQLFKSANFPDSARARQFQLLSRQRELFGAHYDTLYSAAAIRQADTLLKNENSRFTDRILSFQDSVRTIDPNLYVLLLFQQPAGLDEIQKRYLNQNQMILDFWINRERLFVFMISADSLTIFQYQTPATKLGAEIYELMLPLHQGHDVLQLSFDIKLAHELYLQLIKPIEKHFHNSREFIIIPDNFLTGFPFEVLVTDTSIKKNVHAKDVRYSEMSTLAFLVHKYAFSYNYSVKALSPEFLEFRTVKNLGRRLLAMNEPIITPSSSYSSFQIDELYTKLQNMNHTGAEIKRVARLLWRHDVFKKERVTKNNFFNKGRLYRWVYLALPGILNNTNPMNSALLFTQDYSDTLVSTAWMTTGEIMKSRLSADLLTMTGCDVLPFTRGENQGVIALPQSFLFAGVKSVLFNQWHVQTNSTSEFMAKFYWELKYKRQTNALALQQAKIASLKGSFGFSDQKISRAHPYFWASYLVVGNPNIRAPFKERISQNGVVIIVYLMVIFVALYIARKTRQQ